MTNTSLPRRKFCDKPIFVTTKDVFWSRQQFCCDKHTFVVTKDMFCHDKHVMQYISFLSRQNKCLSRQNIFGMTNTSLPRQKFCDKPIFVTTKDVFLVTTNMCLSQQKYVCHNNSFVATSILLSQQGHDKNDPCGSSCQ